MAAILRHKVIKGKTYNHDGRLQLIYILGSNSGMLSEVGAFYPRDPLNDFRVVLYLLEV